MKKNLIYILIAIVVIILIVVFAMGGKKTTKQTDLEVPAENSATSTTLETSEVEIPSETPKAPAAP